MININNDWDEVLKIEFKKDYYKNLTNFLEEEYSNKQVFPEVCDIFSALKYTSYKYTKVVILGQDPYHNDGQAHGLAFSVKEGVKTPPSLLNMYKELNNELGLYIANNGSLIKWARQGVLLLNTVLTVRAHQPNSHKDMGWENFTDNIIKTLSDREDPVIFVLWGANARKKKNFIDENKHYILEAPHPSPLSAYRGFFGCGHFLKINEILESIGKEKIDWQIENI